MLRMLDVGDAFQIFGWRLHDVDMGFWTRSYALFFRLSAGICLTRMVLWVRLTALHGWGLRVDQLVETLTEGDALTRQGAARAWARKRRTRRTRSNRSSGRCAIPTWKCAGRPQSPWASTGHAPGERCRNWCRCSGANTAS